MSKKHKTLHFYIEDLFDKYPNLWCYIVYSGRNRGKTFSTLKYMYDNGFTFGYVKRTNIDVDVLCNAGSGGIDLNPFKKINMFYSHINVKPFKQQKGIGGFFNVDDEGNPVGEAIGYIFSLNNLKDIKGLEAEVDYLIFDEFIPQPWDKVSRAEGKQLLDLYKTIDRDRIHRGLQATTLVLLANPTRIHNPIFDEFGIIDHVVEMDRNPFYDEEYNGICICKIEDDPAFYELECQHPMYQLLKDTDWGTMALNGSFGYDDFSKTGKKFSIKKATPMLSFKYKRVYYYMYQRGGIYYCTDSKFNVKRPFYDLSEETEQYRFWYDYVSDLRFECIDGHMLFKTYTGYDIIMNFKDIFRVQS